jgi:hypothetical protein
MVPILIDKFGMVDDHYYNIERVFVKSMIYAYKSS